MFLIVYLRLYGHCLSQALKGIGKNWWTVLLPIALVVAFFFAAGLLAQLGIVGGFIIGLVLDAAFSCYLYFTGGTVALQKMTVSELRKSFLVYFWSVMGLFFVLWIANLALDFTLPKNARGVSTALNFLALIAFNPAPEVIYTKGTRGGMDTITTSFKFLQENWIEWFIPNIAVGAGAWWLYTRGLALLPLGAEIPVVLFAGALFHLVMVFRGHLFQELDGSTHRQRMFRYRNQK